jgi:hypothetical protein
MRFGIEGDIFGTLAQPMQAFCWILSGGDRAWHQSCCNFLLRLLLASSLSYHDNANVLGLANDAGD